MLMEKTKIIETSTRYSRESSTLALFDFDGTITHKDTLIHFIRFTKGRSRLFWGMLRMLPVLFLNRLGIISNAKAKEKLMSHFFRNMNYAEFKRFGERFCKEKLPSILRPSAIEKINWHQSKLHRVVLVSASIQEWISPWAEQFGIEWITTEMEVKDNRLTGRFSTPNCNGREKVNRIKQYLNIDQYTLIYAYGDTRGDKAMLEIANKPLFRHFD